MAEDKSNTGRPPVPPNLPQHSNEDSILVRQVPAQPLTSMDQLTYGGYPPQPGESGGFDPREIWRKVRKHKYLVLVIVLITTSVVTIESFRNKSYYRATAKIALNEEKSDLKIGDYVIGSNSRERINTELLMIRTYPLLEDVVVALRLDQNPRFLTSSRKSVSESIETIFLAVSQRGLVSKGTQTVPVAASASGRLTAVERTAEEKARLAPYVDALMAALTVEQVPNTRAIDVSYTHTDPVIASDVANGVARVFIDYSFMKKTENFNSSANWLDRTTRSLLAQVEQAEQALAGYAVSHDIYTSSESQDFVGEKLANLYGQVLKAETDRILRQSVYEEVRKGNLAQLPEAFSDQRTAQLRTDLSKLQLKLAELNARFGPDNPRILEVRQQITEIENLIADGSRSLEERLRADYERAIREETLIRDSLTRAKSEVVEQNQVAIQFNILRQKADTAKSLYNDFLQKTNQVNLQKADQYKDLRLIDPARTPAQPVGPQRLRAILLGVLLSLITGIGLALLIEHLDNTVKSIDDVLRVTQLPTLAVIPTMTPQTLRNLPGRKPAAQREKDRYYTAGSGTIVANIAGIVPRGLQPKGNRLATLDGLSSIVESYRMLRTSVLLSTAGNPPRTILITSSQPGEGKTTTAVNTAISLSQLGASVLLIDADLRRPTVHKTFKLPQTRGLSSYLSSSTQLDSLIVRLPMPNLSVLTSGPIPPNPAELIGSERMRELLRTAASRYDHVIIDSPPLITVTDPVILSTLVDGAILVVQAGRSTKDLVRRARQELASVGARIFGVVLNNVNVSREGYDDYYYHRYYSNYTDAERSSPPSRNAAAG